MRAHGGRRPDEWRGLLGVFYPHNILAIFADRLSMEAAHGTRRTADAAARTHIFETASPDPAYVSPGRLHRRRRSPMDPQFAGNKAQPLGVLYADFPPLMEAEDPLLPVA